MYLVITKAANVSVLQKRCSKNVGKIHKKTSVLASLLKKVAGLSTTLGNVRKLEILEYFQGL